jgi:hypothetical protein
LTQLIQTLALLKAEGKKPTAVAYNALMRAAADYANRRGNNLEAGDKSKTIGFEIAMAAYRDAEAGGIDLGTEAVDNLFRVSVGDLLLTRLSSFADLGSSFLTFTLTLPLRSSST